MGVGGGGFLRRNSTAPATTITSAADDDVDAAIAAAAAATSMVSIFSFDGKCRFPLRRKQLTGLCNQITMVNLIRRCSLQDPPPPLPPRRLIGKIVVDEGKGKLAFGTEVVFVPSPPHSPKLLMCRCVVFWQTGKSFVFVNVLVCLVRQHWAGMIC